MSAIEARGVRFEVDGKTILREISLAVQPGQYCSIVGPNGAGKTTLLKILARVLSPSSGEVLCEGRDIRQTSPAEYARRIGYVPQQIESDFPHLVSDFVLMGLYPTLGRWSPISTTEHQAVDDALALVGMRECAQRTLRSLSGGERQRVLLAAALVHRPMVLLLDEPTAFLDPHHEFEIETLLTRIQRERRLSIVAVTHNLNLCALSSNWIIALRDGVVGFSGPPVEFMNAEILKKIFQHEFELALHPRSPVKMILPRSL